MGLNTKQRLDLIEFLVPLLGDESKRKTYFDLVCTDRRNRPDVNLHGTPRNVTSDMVMALESFEIERGRPALVDFLDLIKRWDVGEDRYPQIEAWQVLLLTPIPPASQPPSQSASVGAHYIAPEPKPAPATLSKAEQFSLPAPFEWITIPAGKVTLEGKNESYLKTETTFDVPSFAIGKYPITITAYAQFILDHGYESKHWWPVKGWKQKNELRENLELFKNNVRISAARGAEYDVIAVKWYEAMAFCNWLREKTDLRISLPTEQQWQRAAQGDDGRLYPWGMKWDETNCNNHVGTRKRQGYTAVNQFQKRGSSPYGVVDMVGNAAEWTLTNWRTGEPGDNTEDPRIVRGGSYENQHLNFYRVTTRHKEWPYAECGFRIVRLLDS